jgi:hypothetical protein
MGHVLLQIRRIIKKKGILAPQLMVLIEQQPLNWEAKERTSETSWEELSQPISSHFGAVFLIKKFHKVSNSMIHIHLLQTWVQLDVISKSLEKTEIIEVIYLYLITKDKLLKVKPHLALN